MPRSVWIALLLAGCAGGPPVPDWQAGASTALNAAVAAHLNGEPRTETQQAALARREIARTGRPELAARAEMLCAAHVASLEFGPCEGFERLRADAQPPERAYAAYLRAQPLSRDEIERLPSAQRATATAVAGAGTDEKSLGAIDDPLSRLVAVAVLFQAGKAGPPAIALAADTASQQGWRRPLLAWLNVQALRAEKAGDAAEAARLRRRIDLVATGH
jgi:hypothetical protein